MRGGRQSVTIGLGSGRGRAGPKGRAMRRSRAVGIVASIGAIALAASTLAACDPPIETPDPTVAPNVFVQPNGTIQPELNIPANKLLHYFGGSLLQHVEITPVQYGTWSYGSGTTTPDITKPTLTSFFDTAVDSPYIDWLSEYNARSQTIGRGTVDAWTSITPATINNTRSLSNKKIRAELVNQINAGSLPAPTPDRLYVLFFRKGQTITYDALDSVNGFCGFHNAELTTINGQNVPIYYAVIPYEASNKGCRQGTALQSLTEVTSHEIAESITDSGAGVVSYGWLTKNQHYEIADICSWFSGVLNGFTVQRLWSNQQRWCIVTPP
jgi:hypothetical protein